MSHKFAAPRAVQGFLLAAVMFAAGESPGREAKGPVLTPLRVVGESGFHHADSLSEIVMLSDGRRFLSSSQDGSTRLWDLESGRELRRFARLESDDMWGILVLPGEKEFLTGGSAGYVTRWELATGKVLKTYKHGSTVFRLALRPGGKEFVATDNKNAAVLWNLETGEKVRTFRGHTDSVYTALFTNDGNRLLTGASDGKLKVWNVATGKCVRTYEKETDDIYTISRSPDGSRFAMCSADDRLRVFETETLKVVWAKKLDDDIKVAAWSRDGARVATACENRELYIFDSGDGTKLKTIKVKHRYHTPVAFSNDGKELISGDERMLYRHEIESGKRILPASGVPAVFEGVQSLALSNELVYAVGENDVIQSWCVSDGEKRARFALAATVGSLAVSPDGEVLATGESDGAVTLRSSKTGAALHKLQGEGTVDHVAFARKGAWVISAGSDEAVHLWDRATGRRIRSFRGHENDVNAVAVSPDSLTMFSVSDDKTARLWELESGKEVRRFAEFKERLRGVAALQDGRSFLIAAREPELWGWIAPPLKREGPLSRPEIDKFVRELASEKFARRDAATKALIARGPDILPVLEKLRPDDPEAAFRLKHVRSKIRSAGYEGPAEMQHKFEQDIIEFQSDPTGRYWVAIFGWGVDGKLVVGDLHERKVRVLQEIPDWHSPSEMAFSPDGTTFATGNRDGTVSLYGVHLPKD